jgi:glycosyltransferase involved in cell wall biosynthesis
MDNKLITFILPTVNRDTLMRSVASVVNQTDPEWNLIVGFDGFSNLPEIDYIADPRIEYHLIEEKLGNSKNGSGSVRNYLMQGALTEWVGFIDDDDTIKPQYVEWLKQEINSSRPDCVIFRMTWSDEHNNQVLPPPGYYDFYHCGVGISFAVRLDFIKQHSAWFPQHSSEDFDFLDNLRNLGARIVVSDRIAYNVRF